MQLSNIAILAVRGAPVEFKEKLADEFKVHLATVHSWIRENSINGPLTKTRAVQMISEETGLEPDKILEDQKETQNT